MTTDTALDTVTLDGQQYRRNDLSDNAQSQVDSLRFVDRELQELTNRLAVLQTARAAYAEQLSGLLPEKKAPANKKKDVVTIDGAKYNRADFSEEGLAQLANLQFTANEIERLTNRQAVYRTARNAYAQTLAEELKNLSPVTAH